MYQIKQQKMNKKEYEELSAMLLYHEKLSQEYIDSEWPDRRPPEVIMSRDCILNYVSVLMTPTTEP
jgi:hypothetical protein